MRNSLLPALLAGLALATYAAPPLPASGSPGAADLRRLIEQLGSASFNEREEASAALDAAGEPALPGLRIAAESEDAEVRRRAGDLVRKIELRVETEHLLAPTRVKLSFKDAPLRDAINELCKQSKCLVVLSDPKGKLKERQVTVETGETGFWEALDQLCKAAHLVEEGQQPPVDDILIGRAGPAAGPGVMPPIVVGGGPRSGPMRPIPTFPQLALADGDPAEQPTAYAGAVRIRGRRTSGTRGDIERVSVDLSVVTEPKVSFHEYFSLRIDKVVDDQGQELALADDLPPPPLFPTWRNGSAQPPGYTLLHLQTRLNAGEKTAKSLKEVRGTLVGKLFTELRPMMWVDDILTAAGKSVAGREGGSLKVLEATKDASGRLTLRIELDTPPDLSAPPNSPPVVPGRGRPLRGGPIPVGGAIPAPAPAPPVGAPPAAGGRRVGGLPHLLDDKGNVIHATGALLNVRRGAAGIVREYTLGYSLPAGREASKLVYEAQKAVGVEVPFVLKDISLQ
jgi:hypothetical protein